MEQNLETTACWNYGLKRGEQNLGSIPPFPTHNQCPQGFRIGELGFRV